MKNLQAVNQYIANLAIWNIKLHNFHFNVTGSQFVPAHKYLEEVYDIAFNYYDDVAEHVKMQGEEPVVHVAKYLEIASLKEEPGNRFSVEQVYKFLQGDFELLNKEARAIRESADEEGNFGLVAIMEDHIAYYEKQLWFLRATLA